MRKLVHAIGTVSVAISMLGASAVATADPPGPTPAVKRSRSGICHIKGERGYDETVYFIAFDSLDACLQSGGRLPGHKPSHDGAAPDDKAAYDTDDTTIVKKSRSGVCHDKHSPSFTQIKKYTAYKTMQDCLDSGGRPVPK